MSLRRFDDWDEALEESHKNEIMRDELIIVAKQSMQKDYDYGVSIVISKEELALTNLFNHQ